MKEKNLTEIKAEKIQLHKQTNRQKNVKSWYSWMRDKSTKKLDVPTINVQYKTYF